MVVSLNSMLERNKEEEGAPVSQVAVLNGWGPCAAWGDGEGEGEGEGEREATKHTQLSMSLKYVEGSYLRLIDGRGGSRDRPVVDEGAGEGVERIQLHRERHQILPGRFLMSEVPL